MAPYFLLQQNILTNLFNNPFQQDTQTLITIISQSTHMRPQRKEHHYEKYHHNPAANPAHKPVSTGSYFQLNQPALFIR